MSGEYILLLIYNVFVFYSKTLMVSTSLLNYTLLFSILVHALHMHLDCETKGKYSYPRLLDNILIPDDFFNWFWSWYYFHIPTTNLTGVLGTRWSGQLFKLVFTQLWQPKCLLQATNYELWSTVNNYFFAINF